jgi:hypothetical protein
MEANPGDKTGRAASAFAPRDGIDGGTEVSCPRSGNASHLHGRCREVPVRDSHFNRDGLQLLRVKVESGDVSLAKNWIVQDKMLLI